jgi:hypothetical protein
LIKMLRRPLDGSRTASPPLTLRPAPGATGDFAASDLIVSLSGQQTSNQKQLACVA